VDDFLKKFLSRSLKEPAEAIAYRMIPDLLMEVARRYFRLEIEGLENVPKRGPALITPNHSGYSGFDAMLLSHEIFKGTGRVPRVLTHKFWFMTETTKIPAEKIGFIEANMENGLLQLKKNNVVMLFPEGERGNFKPTAKRYTLQRFKTGFVRLAVMRECPIVPTIIIGAEETHINLAQIKLGKLAPGAILPLPLNVIPLPAKWKIKILPPISLPYGPTAAEDHELMEELAQDIRERMQVAITEEVSHRGSAFFG
jgi:1-acyl-sn-glycerol-3-phosphate acyltransferase